MMKRICGIGVISMFFLSMAVGQNQVQKLAEDGSDSVKNVRFDNTKKTVWDSTFKKIEIKSSLDGSYQKAYFYNAKTAEPSPLIVSLHTWSGDYGQKDELADLCPKHKVHYIHPDFRGANKTVDACCSNKAIQDIDDAISFAIQNANIDSCRIYVIGASGGGYATLCAFMKSTHNIRKFSAWVPISDLSAWHHESKIRKNRYAKDIRCCTGSENDQLNDWVAMQRSPINWETPVEKLTSSHLSIHTGIFDGIQGSVPITHSINFYNKLCSDLSIKDSTKYVSDEEKLSFLEYRKPLGEFGNIGDRKIYLRKTVGNLKLIVFEGNHEMLIEYALEDVLAESE